MSRQFYDSSAIKPTRKIFNELHDIMELVRNILQDDRNLCNKIDAAYEELLIQSLELVPEQYDNEILTSIEIMKIVIRNINFENISKELRKFDENKLRLKINTFDLFKSSMNHLNATKIDKARIMNIVTKFQPLFECVDEILDKPIAMVRKISTIKNNDLIDIFE